MDGKVNALAVAEAAVAYLESVKEATGYAPDKTVLKIKDTEFKADGFTTDKVVELAGLLLGDVTPEEFIKGEKTVAPIKFSATIVVNGVKFELTNETVEFKTDYAKH